MYRLGLVVTVLALTGCSKHAERKRKAGATCPDAAEQMLTIPLQAQGRDLSKLSDAKRAGLDRIVMAFADHCFTDHWSQEAIECLAGGGTPDEIGACKGTLTDAQENIMKNVPDEVAGGNFTLKDPGYRAQIAKREAAREVKQLVADYATWKKHHANRDCPEGGEDERGQARVLAELHFATTSNSSIEQDPWGHTYQTFCGENAPAGAKPFGAASSGPDGQPGTADDIKSW